MNLKALPDPGRARPALEIPLVLPRTPVEQEVAKIWAEILGVNEIGIDDNFLLLGGDSLLASRVISRVLHTFRIELPLRTLFDAPTVAAVALLIAQSGTKQAKSEDVERTLLDVERLPEQAKSLPSKKGN